MTVIASRVAVCALLLSVPGIAQAAEPFAPAPEPLIPGEWTLTIGLEGKVLPKFEGSKDYEILPFPLFSFRRVGTPWEFSSPRDSWDIAIINTGQFAFGPVGNVEMSRDEDDDSALRGLGDVDWVFEAGAFAEFWPTKWLRTRAEVRYGFGGYEGLISEVTADFVVPVAPQWIVSGGPRLTLASTGATAPYFGITPAQSLASGLPVFDAKGGVRAIGAGAQVRYEWNPQWATHAYVEYDRLQGDAAASPLVVQRGSPNQFTVGFGATYSFDIKLW